MRRVVVAAVLSAFIHVSQVAPLAGAAAQLPGTWSVAEPGARFIAVKDSRFVDQDGRQVILHGLNVGQKKRPYLGSYTEEDYIRMHEWGFNCIRLLIFWAGVEPECGKYDEEYLKEIDKRVAWAKRNGLFVLLDMHQDLFSEEYSDGAPKWATLNEGKPHVVGHIWSEAYWMSPAVQAAFDNFWANKPGPDGVGIQDRFALAWGHVAAHFANQPAVVGFDLMNEPFIGSKILTAGLRAAAQLSDILGKDSGPGGIAGLSALFDDRALLLEKLNDMDVFRRLLGGIEGVFQQFERESLGPMYQRVANEIRKVDRRHILFIEPPMSANMGVVSALPPLTLADGAPDPAQALAPHAYDIVVDTPSAHAASATRLRLIFERLQARARQVKLPCLVGEWGGFYGSSRATPVARTYVRLLEEALVGDTYWDFEKSLDRTAFFDFLARPYPQAVAGVLNSYRFDPETRTLTCEWTEDGKAAEPTILYVPAKWFPHGVDAQLEGGQCLPVAAGNYLSIAPLKTAGTRTLIAKPKP
jgi:endoglycosylceramidase